MLSRAVIQYTGYFISPSGVSYLCGTVAGLVAPKGSISTEEEALQVSVLPSTPGDMWSTWQTFLARAGQSWTMIPTGLFVSQCTGRHCAGISCTTHELFCLWVVPCGTWSETSIAPSHLTHFGRFQDTECFLISCPHHVSSQLPLSGETCKYATSPSTQKNLERFSFLLCLSLFLHSQVWKFQRDLWITLYITDMRTCTHEISSWKLGHHSLGEEFAQVFYWQQCKYA
jgi:hypothetical protein